MKSFYIETLGCKVNHYESDAMALQLSRNGFQRVDDQEEADVVIVNSCAVTSKAAMQSRQAARKLIRSNPGAKVIFTGCHAQTEPEKAKEIENLCCIAGHRDKFRLPEAIMAWAGNDRERGIESIAPPESGRCHEREFISFEPAVTGDKTRAYLKIQDGCNAFCTYCIIPHARGRSRSMPEDQVMDHLERLNSLGYREAVITGIHAGEYGLDLEKKSSLTELFEKIHAGKRIHRIRLSSIEPRELTRGLIDLAAEKKTLCDHFHISLQSGDDTILERMHRPYDREFFRSLILKIHEKIPSAAIGVDILQGFPGETEAAFENTRSLIESLPVSYLHVFPFSPRKGTPAYDYPDKVDPKTIKARCAVMRRLGEKKTREFEKRSRNRPLDAVIQGKRDPGTGMLKAVTSNYLTLLVNGGDEWMNRAVTVTLDTADADNTLYGTLGPQIL
ncbi:MAG TPA: tRNA (N(6)-L-threonylcarbamoyladenosine(37)-C(2))-methylthiotransferase MtaB [Desulfobacteraceae bacterium]|nr:tRNA (N(6)-L-threonylcarbamoyladenosine(37)-C(2))-methylthiotransferase MtaB [Desulfobacteraceae bacterium]